MLIDTVATDVDVDDDDEDEDEETWMGNKQPTGTLLE